MEEFTTTLLVRPLDSENLNTNDLVVLAGTLRRVVGLTGTTVTLTDDSGTRDTFPLDFFGPTWMVAVL